MRRYATTIATLALLLCGGTAGASALCDRLGFELATLSTRAGPGAEARKFGRAIVEQKRSLRELERTSRRTGCSAGSLAVIGGPNAAECDELAEKRTRMERNLEILERKRIELLSDDGGARERRRLIAALDQNGCNDEPVYAGVPEETRPLVLDGPAEDGFETIRIPPSDGAYDRARFVDLGGASVNGTYRTMCVRACDGAYFPVSSHASTMSFRRDAQVCSMMCPGTDTELYFHSIYQESDEMRSASTGRRYEDLKNAYRFRTAKAERDSSCGCNFSLYYREMMKREAYIRNPEKAAVRESSIVWLKPELRGGLRKPLEASAALPAQKLRTYVPDPNIRVIGPRFLPDDGIDFSKPLPDPAGTPVP